MKYYLIGCLLLLILLVNTLVSVEKPVSYIQKQAELRQIYINELSK